MECKPGKVFVGNGLTSAPSRPLLTWHNLSTGAELESSLSKCRHDSQENTSGTILFPSSSSSSSSSSPSTTASTSVFLTHQQHGKQKSKRYISFPSVFESHGRKIPDVPSSNLDDVLPSLQCMTHSDLHSRSSLPIQAKIQIMQKLITLTNQIDFPKELKKREESLKGRKRKSNENSFSSATTASATASSHRSVAPDSSSSSSSSSSYELPLPLNDCDPGHMFLTLLSGALDSKETYARKSCPSYETFVSIMDFLLKYKLEVLTFALTLLEDQSVFAMEVFFGIQEIDDGNDKSAISVNISNATVKTGPGNGQARGAGTGASTCDYTILQKLLYSWTQDLIHLDSLDLEIAPGSIDDHILTSARTTAKIFLKLIVLVRPCCITFLQALGCQHNFENILHRVQNDWIHPALLENKEDLVAGLNLAYETVSVPYVPSY
jgi:hypothetical protein